MLGTLNRLKVIIWFLNNLGLNIFEHLDMNKRVLLFLFYFYACYQSVPLKFKKHDQSDFIKNKNFLKQSFVDSFNREFENEINLENVKGNSGIVYCSVCEVLLSSIR